MKKLTLLGLFLSITLLLTAQPFKLSEKVPFDINSTKGVLKNGLTYYVKSNSTPKNRAELMLVVSAGSVSEDADQLGLAHFCEHMSFNGTKNFPKNDLIKYFESIGMEFGPEINAYTSFDETVYMIKIPLDKEEYLQKGLQVLYDWASQVTDSDDEIVKERGVVHEEWRGGQGAQKRMLNQWIPVFLKDSKYAQRLPIGDPQIIDNCKPEVLRRFRKDWYRPDLQSIIVVGDFDKTKIINLIKEKFSAIPAQANPRKKEIAPVPGHHETLVKIVTDKEATYSSASVYIKHPMNLDLTIKGYRNSMVNGLYNQMINLRLSELAQKENPPFVMGQAEYGSLIGPSDVYTSTAITHPGKIPAGLKAVLLENERVKKFGFTQSELDRNKNAALKYMETSYNNRGKRESMSLAQEFTRNFLMRQEPTPGIEVEYQYYKEFMPTITLEEINALAKKWINTENRVVVITAPELANTPAPTEAEIRAVLTEVESQKIEQYADVTSSEPLMKSMPTPGKVTSEKKIASVDATEWTLSNGAKVVYKKTDFKDDEILFTAYSLGGWSLYGQDDNMSASFASTIMDQSGIADYNNTTLKKMLSGKSVNVTPVLKMLTQGIEGSSNVSDLETCLQLINLYFTKPRFDESAFSSYITRMHSQLDNSTVSPERAFADTFKWTTSNYHPRMKPLTKEMLDEAKFSRITQIAKERYANPGAFTFFFVGKIDPIKFKPLVEKYIASLANGQKAEKWVDLGVRKPNGVVEKTVFKGKEPKSIQYIQFHGKLNYASKDLMEIDALGKILTTRLLESIREDKSSVYYIGAQPGMVKFPHPEFDMTIYYGTAPEKVKDLKTSVFTIIKDLVVNGPKQEEVDKAREKIKRERETNLRENNYWQTTLKSYYLNMNGDFKTFDEFNGAVTGLNAQSLKAAAAKTFDFKNYTSVALMPEKSEAVK
ncbi:MAG: insulinase family protein [Bacteroidia bacterium]|nr:insulinase family protein [Bacteroidia bacterium]